MDLRSRMILEVISKYGPMSKYGAVRAVRAEYSGLTADAGLDTTALLRLVDFELVAKRLVAVDGALQLSKNGKRVLETS